ncbi:MAG: ArsR family transcriptional regulator [Chloroflexi bacterium]|jgi:DNA-binding transcriptional ArsR family regulator|nr:MAG: ArsR family transcriptional regulator [Chloroflexota bacterium]
MNRSIFEIQADFCKAMGNAARLQILHVLREHAMHVGEIARATGFSPSLVSRQLGILRNVGVVQCQRQGNEMLYQLSDEDIGEVCDLVRKVLSAQMHRQSKAFSGTDA